MTRTRAQQGQAAGLPLRLFAGSDEAWSPSTGDFDVEEKLREYQRRGDLEIWRIDLYGTDERTLTVWRRRPDGSYAETLYRSGAVTLSALPNVTIELSALFPAWARRRRSQQGQAAGRVRRDTLSRTWRGGT